MLIKKIFTLLYQKGLIHILSGTFLLKIVSFFGSTFLVRVLSKHDYGVLGYIENIYGYALVLAGMGMSNSILRFVILGKDVQEKCNYFFYASRQGLLWNIVLIFFVGIVGRFYPHPEIYIKYVWLILVLLVALPFQYFSDNALCNERAMFSNQRYAIMTFFLSAGILSTKILFGKTMGIYGAVIGQTMAYILLGIIFIYITWKKYYTGLLPQKLENFTKRNVNIYSFQYMITNGLWAIFMLNDTFLLGRFCLPEVIANYKVAYAIPGSVSLISSSIGIFVGPYFVKNEDNLPWIRKNFFRTYILTSLFVGIICITVAIITKPIILVLYGEKYLEIAGLMRIMLISSFCNCGLRFTTANIMAAMGKVKYNMLVSVIGMIIQLGLNIILIPKFNAYGAAITSCIVYTLMALILFFVFIKQYFKQ